MAPALIPLVAMAAPTGVAAGATSLGLTITTAAAAGGTFAAIGGAAGALSIASGAIGALSAMAGASAKSSALKSASKQATIEGQIAENEGRAQALARRQQANIQQAELVASLGASGVDINTGSAASAIQRSQEIGKFNVDTAFNSAMQSMAGARTRAKALSIQAGSAADSGFMGVAAAGIGAAGGVLTAIERKKRLV